jgi:hypothetical protein
VSLGAVAELVESTEEVAHEIGNRVGRLRTAESASYPSERMRD